MLRPTPGSKTSKRKHLQQVYKTTGKKPDELANHPRLPEQLSYIWRWYSQLQNGARLSFSELQAWSYMTGCQLLPSEAQLIMTLDRIFWGSMND